MVVMGLSRAFVPCDKLEVTVCSDLQQLRHDFCFFCLCVFEFVQLHANFVTLSSDLTLHFHVQIWTLYPPPLKYVWLWDFFFF